MTAPGPRLAIRADAGNRIGTGHIMRCLAIAQEWIDRGGGVIFLCAAIPDALATKVRETGAEVSIISEEAEATAETCRNLRVHVLLVDSYTVEDAWWAALPGDAPFLTAAINDFREPMHTGADLRISPRVSAIPGEPHSGSDYFLIRSEILREDCSTTPPANAARVLLVLGGADPDNIGPGVLRELLAASEEAIIRVIVGPAATNLNDFLLISTEEKRVQIVQSPPSMREHFLWADTAVVSPSTTAFEVLHHGLPTGLVVIAGNQVEVGAELVSGGLALQLADRRESAAPLDSHALRSLFHDGNARKELADRASAFVDGKGAGRVCDALGLPRVTYHPVTEEDTDLTWRWANDPGSRAASFSSEKIPIETHRDWLAGRIRSGAPTWIAKDGMGIPLAFVRFDSGEEDAWVISLNLAPESRGKGLSPLIVAGAVSEMRRLRPDTVIDAWIRRENIASQRCFTRAGFRDTNGAQADGRLLFTNRP